MSSNPSFESSSTSVGVLLLAAGFSRRFGDIKLQANLASGQTVFARTLTSIAAATPDIVVVTREQLMQVRHDISRQTNSNIVTLLCPDSELGMGHTLAYGVKHLARWDACLVCLGDMPFVTTETYRSLLAELRADLIIQPTFEGRVGNPIGFGSRYFPALQLLSGDTGGREVVKANRDRVRRIALSDPAILQDIDTPEDLARLDNGAAR